MLGEGSTDDIYGIYNEPEKSSTLILQGQK